MHILIPSLNMLSSFLVYLWRLYCNYSLSLSYILHCTVFFMVFWSPLFLPSKFLMLFSFALTLFFPVESVLQCYPQELDTFLAGYGFQCIYIGSLFLFLVFLKIIITDLLEEQVSCFFTTHSSNLLPLEHVFSFFYVSLDHFSCGDLQIFLHTGLQ